MNADRPMRSRALCFPFGARSLAGRGFAVMLVLVAAAAECVAGEDSAYPHKPIRMVVPFSPGTTSDFLARTLGLRLADAYKVQVVIDNRAGAGGLMGSTIVSTAVPDGYTIAPIGPPHIVGPLLQAKQPYRPLEDVTPIAEVATTPNALVASPTLPVKNVHEFLALARAKPGQFNFASGGVGSSAHLGAEIFNRASGIRAVHVPFKATSESYAAIVAGQVHYYVYVLPTVIGLMRGGKLHALAVTSDKRSSALPDVPSVVEAGIPGARYETWFGIVAPAGTPQRIIAQLNGDIAKQLRDPEVRTKFVQQGAEPAVDTTPDAFGRRLKNEYARFHKLVKELDLKPE
jgi:tripartite-type tricarboxylate transporter receptor subunit TctC